MQFNEVFKPDPMLTRILVPIKPEHGRKYIPSQFVLCFVYGGKHYASNLLTKQCIEATLPDFAYAGEGYDELIKTMFLVPDNKDECAFYMSLSTVLRAYEKHKGIQSNVIMPTLGCNARCIYCYEEGMKQVTMTPEIIEQTIRFIVDNRRGNKLYLSWFGGEPLLCPDIIDRISEGVREAGMDYASTMITNGSLITPEIVKKMSGDWHLSKLQISMDGAEEDYLYRKNYYSYHDYYHKVIDSINLLSENGIHVVVRCNIDEDNWERIPQYVEDLKNGVAEKKNVRLYFAPLNGSRLSDDDLPLWKKVLHSASLIRKAGFEPAFNEGNGHRFAVTHCMADKGDLVIAPDGSLYPCEHCPPESRFGDIYNGVTNQVARDEFCRVDIVQDKCRRCSCLPICTAFRSCPIKDKHCREARELITLGELETMMAHGVNANVTETNVIDFEPTMIC